MVVAVSDLISLRWVVEATYGAGAAAAAMTDMRITGESLEQTTENRRSSELRDDAQIEDDKRVNIGVTGSVEGLFSYLTWDTWMMYALRAAAWSTAVTTTMTTYSIDDGDNSINDDGAAYGATASLAITTNDTITRDGGSWITEGFRVGMVVTCASSEDVGNDGDHTITVLTATVMTIGAAGLTDNGADTAMLITNAGGFLTDTYVANQWIEIRGFTTSANNGYFKIVSVVAAKMVLAGGTVVTEVAGDSVTVLMGAQITNGTTLKSMSIEREYSSPAAEFVEYQG